MSLAYKMIPRGARRRYGADVSKLPVTLALGGLVLAMGQPGCGPGPDDELFGFVGEVADASENGTALGLFVVSSTPPVYVYKLGDGSSVANQFDISFDAEPPTEAINSDGVGVAQIGLLPGLATVTDGVVVPDELRLVGITTNHAIIFKAAGAVGPAWSQLFPPGFSCAHCVRDTADGLDTFEPAPCDRVVIEASQANPCVWY